MSSMSPESSTSPAAGKPYQVIARKYRPQAFDDLLDQNHIKTTLRNAIERCPAFITFCPACAKENPWLAGLNEQCVCLHCGSVYTGSWGIWKDSTTYRRTKESLTRPLEPGAVTLRANLPAR